MTPAAQLGQLLATAQRTGTPFADAWPAAVTRALADVDQAHELEAWSAALTATREAWQAAWERRGASRSERALAAVAVDPDREALPDRACGLCGAELPPSKGGPPRRWCSDRCRRAASDGRPVDAVRRSDVRAAA